MKIEKQLQTIQSILKKEDKTVAELAKMSGLSEDTVRSRLNFLKTKRKVRITDWIVRENTMVRIWGSGSMPDEPRPVRVRVGKPRPRRAVEVKACCPAKMVYRREPWDEWMFRVKGRAA
jgi:hypothetical protein